MKFVSKSPINNIPALVQIVAWHRPGYNSLSEPMMVRLLMHICVTRPQLGKPFILPGVSHVCKLPRNLIISYTKDSTFSTMVKEANDITCGKRRI